jgi:hypothetical protein
VPRLARKLTSSSCAAERRGATMRATLPRHIAGNQSLLRQANPRTGGGANPAAAVPKTTLSDCRDNQIGGLTSALSRADADLATAVAALAQRPLPPAVADALWLAFRSNGEGIAGDVSSKLQRIRNGLPGATVECEQTDSLAYNFFCSGADAYVRAAAAIAGAGSIHLCMGNWEQASAERRASVLIHEGAHRFFNATDEGYFANCQESEQTGPLNAADRLNNADGYACVVAYLAQGDAADLRRRVRWLRGETITGISQTPAGPIDLNSADVRSPDFSVAFDNGGPAGLASYRWVIADPADQRYLMWSELGGVFEFGTQNRYAYIPSKTRALLKERGIRQATVLCRVRIPAGAERLYQLPIALSG